MRIKPILLFILFLLLCTPNTTRKTSTRSDADVHFGISKGKFMNQCADRNMSKLLRSIIRNAPDILNIYDEHLDINPDFVCTLWVAFEVTYYGIIEKCYIDSSRGITDGLFMEEVINSFSKIKFSPIDKTCSSKFDFCFIFEK